MRRGTRSLLLLVLLAGTAVLFTGVGGSGAADDTCSAAPAAPSLELVYRLQADGDGLAPGVGERTVEIVCRRLRELVGVSGEVRALGGNRIRVVLPDLGAARSRRAIEQIGIRGQVSIYDWEQSLLGRERRIGGRPGFLPPVGALNAAKREWRAAGRDVTRISSLQLIYAGALPTARAAARLAAARERRMPAAATVVSELPVVSTGRIDQMGRPGWYALRDTPALTGADIIDAEGSAGEFGEPTVVFGFTDRGRRAFQRVTRTIARRGQARARGPVTISQAEALSGHLAIVLDGEVRTRPIVNFAQNPDGIDGRSGVQFGGFDSRREARDLAAILNIGALPVDLVLVRQRPR